MSFFNELKRRNVFKVGVAYAVACWLLLQIIDLVLENINAPDWVMQVFMLAMAVGLPLALIVAWAFELTPDGVKLQKHVDQDRSIARQTGHQLNRGIIMILSMAVVLLLTDKFRDEAFFKPEINGATTESTEQNVAEVDEDETRKSIAVLPFVNMSSDQEQDYFADGISEEILNSLASVSDLKVAGRTSSFAFKGKNEDLLEIGKVLRVNHILEGSVRKSGNRIRITAQLIKVDDGFHMWSQTWDRELNDIFVIQDEISAAILVQMKTQLLGEQPVSVQTDTRAYELYLLAKQRIYDRTTASLEMGVSLLDEAIDIDANYAPAFAQLGVANLLLSERNYGTLPHTEAGENAKRYLDTALQLDPQNAEALAGMGLYYSNHELDHQKSIDVLQQALQVNPNLINANTWLATELDTTGNLRAGLLLREQTLERDPLHPPTFGNLQQSYTVMGQNEKALKMLDDLQAYLPGDAKLIGDYGQVRFMSGELAESRRQFQQSFDKEPGDAVNRFWYSILLINARQYGYASEIAGDRVAPLALSRLGRSEEALILGKKATGSGINPTGYFQVLVENGRFAELIQVLESHWKSLDDFSEDWPGRSGYGYPSMGFIAQAYRELGNEEKFSDAMQRFKVSLEGQLAEGANNWPLHRSQALYAVLANDYENAISLLEKAFQQGAYIDIENATAWPVFKPLDGDPRYEAAKKAMNARFQEEMKKMELEPLKTRQAS